ncbi:MAG: type IV pilin protein [Casimicrobiaceae bacterium]
MSTKPIATSRSVARGPAVRGDRGFTLLEVMIVVAIVAILAAIALPNYADYVKRGKIIEATSGLSDMRTRFEQWYLDNRTYAGGCGAFGGTVQATVHAFTITCAAAANTYTATATGNAAEGMSGFVYTIDQANVHATSGTYWGPTNATCWVTRKDGSCS